MTALLDVNILLDVFLKRDPWFDESRAVWQACDDGKFDGYVSAVTVTNIWYLARRMQAARKRSKPSSSA